jgi:hypothetical protein
MKISIAWLAVIALVFAVLFFSYQIASVSGQTAAPTKMVRFEETAASRDSERTVHSTVPSTVLSTVPSTVPSIDAAPVVQTPPPNKMPRVPAQTTEDLQLDEPLRATPPATQYDAPDATDPLNRVAFQDAEFGSNLRHPEQMIERRPKPTMAGAVGSGIASQRSSPGANNAQGYSTEMVQNGGDFMGAVLAFDGSEVGNAYSLI